MSETVGQVGRRRVIYIPGYDPIPPRRYRELYRKEGAAQSEISGYDLAIRPRAAGGTYGWGVAARIDGVEVAAEVDVLVWSDIVQSSMARSIPATYLQLLQTAWIYISTGALRRLMRLRKGPVIAALYPVHADRADGLGPPCRLVRCAACRVGACADRPCWDGLWVGAGWFGRSGCHRPSSGVQEDRPPALCLLPDA